MSAFSYLSLERVAPRQKPRADWVRRWYCAAHDVKFKGVVQEFDENGNPKDTMIAEKRSPIWAALARGAGGFRDACGKGKPPFAFGSGMGWVAHQIAKPHFRKLANSHWGRHLTHRAEGQATQENEKGTTGTSALVQSLIGKFAKQGDIEIPIKVAV